LIDELKKQNEELTSRNILQKAKYEELLKRIENITSSSAVKN